MLPLQRVAPGAFVVFAGCRGYIYPDSGVVHEFSSIPGVREDVTDLVLNLKGVAVRMDAEGPKRLRLNVEGPAT